MAGTKWVIYRVRPGELANAVAALRLLNAEGVVFEKTVRNGDGHEDNPFSEDVVLRFPPFADNPAADNPANDGRPWWPHEVLKFLGLYGTVGVESFEVKPAGG